MNHLERFNVIAPFYALFYPAQVKLYTRLLARIRAQFKAPITSVLDVGCGTGAMVEVFSQHFTTLGIDGSQRMLDQAHNRFPIGMFQQVDFTQGLPFEDKSFDLVYASFVLHGIPQVERSALLEEMKRVSQQQVIIFDYHHGRNILIDSVEYLEQGDYFNFINTFESEFKQMFSKHTTLPLNKYSELYVGDVT